MSVLTHPAAKLSLFPRRCGPPLENGDRLTRAEFMRRYDAMPDLKKAELIEGVVYVPSPVRQKNHGRPHSHLIGWLFIYEAGTPGVEIGDNSTVLLDLDNAPQPDGLLFIQPEPRATAAASTPHGRRRQGRSRKGSDQLSGERIMLGGVDCKRAVRSQGKDQSAAS